MRVSRGPAMSEVVMEGHFPSDGHLVSRHAALEEIREFLHVLKLHESEVILRTKHRCNANRFEAAIGDILEVPAHFCWGKTAHTTAQNVIPDRHFRFHSVLQHLIYLRVHIMFD